MIINVVEFPAVRRGKDKELKEWFAWSNDLLEMTDDFISRRLLAPAGGEGHYLAIVEHESEESLKAMHTSRSREQIAERLGPLLDGQPVPRLYRVAASKQAQP